MNDIAPENRTTMTDILLAILIIGGLVVTFAFILMGTRADYLKKDLSYYKTTYLSKVGSTCLWKGSNGGYINYELRSFDAGKSWYATHRTNDTVIIDGNAEIVYPGLMTQLQAMDDLCDYVQKNGPIRMGTASEIGLLKSAGFGVTTK